MLRAIEGFHQDDEGDWVAELSCLHAQHVRHSPPFRDRPWVRTEAGRAKHIGTMLECPLCDRAELPDGLVLVRTAGPFTAESLPAGLQREHRVAERTWGRLVVLEGEAVLAMQTKPPITRHLGAGEAQPIPPTVGHLLRVMDAATVAVEFLTRPEGDQ